MKIKNKMKKAALAMTTAALTSGAVRAAGTDVAIPDNDAVSVHQTVDSNVRVISGVLMHDRYTDVHIVNSDKQYKVYYLDTDNDLLEDCICVQLISQNELRCDYAPGTRLVITEVRGNDGKWLVSEIDVQKTRRILSPEKSR